MEYTIACWDLRLLKSLNWNPSHFAFLEFSFNFHFAFSIEPQRHFNSLVSQMENKKEEQCDISPKRSN